MEVTMKEENIFVPIFPYAEPNKNRKPTSRELAADFNTGIIHIYTNYQELCKYLIPRIVTVLQKNYLPFEYTYKSLFKKLVDNQGIKIDKPDEDIKNEVNPDTTIEDIKNKYLYNIRDSEDLKREFYRNEKDINKHLELIQNELTDVLYNNSTSINERLKNVLAINNKNLSSKNVWQEIIHLLKLKYNFFVVDTPKGNNRYETTYYIIDNGYYTEINRAWLMDELQKSTTKELYLTLDDCSKILAYITTVKEFDNRYVEFENVYIKKSNMEIIQKTDDNHILTKDRLGLYDDESFKLYSYDENITLDKITDENITETFKILQEILIPKHSPGNTKFLLFYLQLIGLMVHGKNDIKILPLFYKEGNNGKTILKDICETLFKDGSISIAGNEFKDKFINESINKATHCILNDELEIDDIKKYQSSYKNISGGSSLGGRGMYTTEQVRADEIAPALLCSNYIPNIPIDKENEAIIKRLIIISMPNKFVESYEYNENKNHFHIRSNIRNIISNDYEGLSQVLSVAINEFKKLNYSKNVKEQLALAPTMQDTLFLLTKENPLLSFMMLYLEETPENTTLSQRITTTDIRNSFIEWYKPQNNELEPPETMITPINIGKNIKTVFPEINIKSDGNKQKYNLKIKSMESIINKSAELIKGYPVDPNNATHKIFGLKQNIHDYIMTNNYGITEQEIFKEFEPTGYEEDIIEALQYLDEVGLIEYQKQKTLF